MIKNIIFDFDGTLADTAEGILETEKAMLRQLGLPLTSDAQMRAGIGLPLALSLEKGCNLTPETVPEAVRVYRELFDEIAPRHIVVFDGVKETLSELKRRGIRMAIATSRGSRSLGMILREHALETYFDFTLSADSGIPLKPRPDMVLELMRMTGGTPQETLVVGDTTFDIDMGNGALARTAAVTYGNHPREMLLTSHPTWIIASFPEILALTELD